MSEISPFLKVKFILQKLQKYRLVAVPEYAHQTGWGTVTITLSLAAGRIAQLPTQRRRMSTPQASISSTRLATTHSRSRSSSSNSNSSGWMKRRSVQWY